MLEDFWKYVSMRNSGLVLGLGCLGCVKCKSSLTSNVTLVCDDAFLVGTHRTYCTADAALAWSGSGLTKSVAEAQAS